MTNTPPYSPYHHSMIRLPPINQLSSNGGSITQFFNQKITKSNLSDSKPQQNPTNSGSSNVKRKRSWSRAVFSNLQRKGLERQFEFQKYITKPDRKKLAARLGLKDAQVKVWFQVRKFWFLWHSLSFLFVNFILQSLKLLKIDQKISSQNSDFVNLKFTIQNHTFSSPEPSNEMETHNSRNLSYHQDYRR